MPEIEFNFDIAEDTHETKASGVTEFKKIQKSKSDALF